MLVRFLKNASGYIDYAELRYFKAGEVADINDSLVRNFISLGCIELVEESPVEEVQAVTPVEEVKVSPKKKKGRKKND